MYYLYFYNTYDNYYDEKRRFDITDKLNFTLGNHHSRQKMQLKTTERVKYTLTLL